MSQLICDISVFCNLSSSAEAMANTSKGNGTKNLVFILLVYIFTLTPVQTWGRSAIGNTHPKPGIFDSIQESAALSSQENPSVQADIVLDAHIDNIEKHLSHTLKNTMIAATTASASAQIKVRVLGNNALKPKISRRRVWMGEAALLTLGSGTPPYEVNIEKNSVAYAKKLNETTYLIVGIVPGETIITLGDAKGISDTVYFEVLNLPEINSKSTIQ